MIEHKSQAAGKLGATESNRVVGLVGAVPSANWLRSRTDEELAAELERLAALAERFGAERPEDVELADALVERAEAIEAEVRRRKERPHAMPAPLLAMGGRR